MGKKFLISNVQSLWGAVLTAMILLLSPWFRAEAQTCPSNHTEVRISQKILPPRIDMSKNQGQLTSMQFNDSVASDRRFVQLTGLTVAGIAVDQELRFASTGPEDGPNCVWPSVVTITLSTAPTIYIVASHGQCLTGLGIAHEQKHVGVNNAIIERYSAAFRQHLAAMTEAIAEEHAPPTKDPQSLRSRMEEKISAMIAVTADTMYADWSKEQRAVDSPQEYMRISAACPQVTVEPGFPSGGHIPPGG
jgi:hypothetical protein